MNPEIKPPLPRQARAYAKNEARGRTQPSATTLEAVVRDYAGLVRRVARRMARATGGAVDLDDLTSVGVLGLIDAHQRYDPSGGRPFPVYAEYRIRGAILDELRRLDPMTQPMRRRARAMDKARRELATILGREPEDQELAEHMGVTLERVQTDRRELQPQSFVPEDEVDDIRPDLAGGAADRASTKSALAAAIRTLPERQQQILALYYFEDLTLKEIGTILEVTEARVCQLHKVAVVALREQLTMDD